MGDLATDTAVEQTGPSTFACNLSPDWEIWGPNGGYFAVPEQELSSVVASALAGFDGDPVFYSLGGAGGGSAPTP